MKATVTAKCPLCKWTKTYGPGDVPPGGHPICEKCYAPMVAESAKAKP